MKALALVLSRVDRPLAAFHLSVKVLLVHESSEKSKLTLN